MTQETKCPACGAPLVYSGNQEVIHCTFCGTDLRVAEEDGQPHFQVLAQPEPQKEILDQPVEGAGSQPGGAQIYPASPPATPFQETPMPFQPVLGGAAVYPINDQPAARKSVNRWIWVAIAMLVGLAIVCACGVLALGAFISRRGF
jgi:hypothetical protein